MTSVGAFFIKFCRLMNVNIDLGNIWDAFSALGTVGAVVLSLLFAYVKKKKTIKVSPAV